MNSSNLTTNVKPDFTSKALSPTMCVTPWGIYDVVNPQEKDIKWDMIAQSLSRQTRFNGLNGDIGGYSIAQHCVLGADALMEEQGDTYLAAHFLLHDAHEAFIGDITRPVESYFGPVFSEQVTILKTKWDEKIYSVASLVPPSAFNRKDLVTEMDDRMLAYEFHCFFPNLVKQIPEMTNMVPPKIKGVFKPWGPATSEIEFLDRLEKYLGINVKFQSGNSH